MGSHAGGGEEGASSGESSTAAATGGDNCAGSSPAGVAARLHLHQRRQHGRAKVSVVAGAGIMHETVKIWHLAAWLMTTWAFKALAMHH
jgi:hypothetical protein